MQIRDKNLDNLRVIAAFMVVLAHIAGIYIVDNIENPNINFTIGNFYDSISRTCVPIFVMLSGTFILDNPKNKNYRVFYLKTINKIIIPTLIWSLIYFLYSLAIEIQFAIVLDKDMEIMKYVIKWINGKPFYHLWYLYMIFGLYLISPILIRVIEDIGEKSTFKLGVVFTILGFVVSITSELFWPILFIEYIGYFILGYSLRKYYLINPVKPIKYLVGAIVTALLLFVVTDVLIRLGWGNGEMILKDGLSPFVIVGSIFLFIAFVNMGNHRLDLSYLSKHIFNIYVIHAGLLYFIGFILHTILKWDPNPMWFIPVLALIVFGLSYVGSLMVYWILSLKISQRVKDKLEKKVLAIL